jgi:hypothetical protein
MKVLITRDTVADGKPVKASEKPVDITDAAAKALIAMNKAVAYTGKETPVKTPAAKEPPADSGKKQESGAGDNGEGDVIDALDLEDMTYAELEETGKEYGVSNKPKMKEADLKKAIQEAYQQQAAA